MSEKIIKFVVYILGILIIIALIGVLYGMYLKINKKSSKNYSLSENFSLNLSEDYEIRNMQVINSNEIFITIFSENEIQGIIYDIDKKQIIQKISK